MRPYRFIEKKILITGVAGLVGHRIAKQVLDEGAEVLGIDNFLTGQRGNIDRLQKAYKKFSFIEENVLNLDKNPFSYPFDYILHLASPASPKDFDSLPLEIIDVNVSGTRLLLEQARQSGARLLFASTSEVYGDPEVHPQPESYFGSVNTLGIRSPYDESKRLGETLLSTYRRIYQVETRIVRIFNTYGPGMRAGDGRVIPNFIEQALRGEDITIYGDGQQTRSFCYVDDLVDAILLVLLGDDSSPFNCGSEQEYTILDCAKIIIEKTQSKSQIIHCELPQNDPKLRRPDLRKIEASFGYRPKFSFSDGLAPTIDYFSEILSL